MESQQQLVINPKPVDHVAIMKKSWGLTEKVLSGEKTVESRWYKTKHTPWDKIKTGDNLYFKDIGEPVTIKTRVAKVLQFANLTPEKIKEIMARYGRADLGVSHVMPEIKEYITGKNYAIFVFFDNVEKLKKPFEIDKTGFGAMAAWITVNDIEMIKIG